MWFFNKFFCMMTERYIGQAYAKLNLETIMITDKGELLYRLWMRKNNSLVFEIRYKILGPERNIDEIKALSPPQVYQYMDENGINALGGTTTVAITSLLMHVLISHKDQVVNQ